MNESAEPIFYRGVDLLVRHAKYLILVSFVGSAAGVAISFLFTPVFKADAILIPSDEMLGKSETSQLAGLGGLATLIGVGGAGSRENEAVAILKSRALTYGYIQTNTLMPILFHNRWNPVAKTWNSIKQTPTLGDGYKVFDNIRTIIENRKTGLITISVTWEDPKLAKQWVDGLVNAANDLLRHQAIERSTKNLEYLQNASEKTSIMEVRTTIYKLMEGEIKKQMTALGNNDYAFRVVDPAVIPEHKSAPKRWQFAAFGGVVTGMVWFLVIVFKSRVKSVDIPQARSREQILQ
jgi:uncharacterized protein involved in exopolysaccharide biosynthesis